jgi:transitional endoplasmic reticulum ATPase
VRERVLSQLLAELDGLAGRARVLAVAATNRPDRLDAALLRPGRFDRLVYVPPPNAAARAAILRVVARKMRLGGDVALGALAERTEGYTGVDLRALCSAAAMAALDESLEAPHVCARHFETALRACRPSPPPDAALVEVYRSMQRGSGRTRV